jgi:filamentous hemagglutinin
MTTTIKITELTNIGANLASTTVFPVVNMAGTPTTQKTVLGNIANVILAGAGNAYVAVGAATVSATVTTNAQPNITSMGNLTGLTVSNASGTVNFSNTANVTLGAVGNLRITGGTAGQLLSTNGNGTLSWASDTTTYGNSNVVTLLSAFGSNTITTTGNISGGNLVTGGEVVASGNVSSGTGFTTGGFLSVNGTADLHDTTVTGYANITGTANVVGGGATVGVRSILAIDSAFGSNSSADPASAQAVRGRVTGANLTKTRNYVTGVTGQYLITGTNASEFIKAGVLGVVGDQTTTADGAVVAYLDGDGGLTTANAAYAVSMKNSTPNSGFNYGLDLQFIDLNLGGVTTSTFKQADIRFNNGVKLVANTAGNISINGNVTVGNIIATNIGNIATINLTGNSSNVLYGNGVFAAVAGGANTGNVTFNNVTVQGVNGLNLSAGADFTANLAYLQVRSGDVASHIHLDTGNNEAYDLIIGDDDKFVQVSSTGNIIMSSYDGNASSTWTFDTTGNLNLPLGSIVYETNIPDQSLSGSAIALKPIGGTTANQQLLIYPTAADGDHIHMTSGNLYATELFLGSDNFYVKLANTGNIVINSNDGNSSNAMWTFDTDGNLTLPGNLVINGLTNVFGSNVALLQSNPDLPLLSVSSGSNGGVSSLWVEDIGNVGTSNIAAVYANPTSGSGIVRIAVGQNGGAGGPNLWDFNANGTTTLPGNLISSGASPAPSISGFDSISSISVSASGNISANNFTGNGGGLSNVATKISSSWSLASGNNTVSISVPLNGTYAIWVNGNIPNGIITYTATAVVTNTNVPVLGEQYAWYYAVGNALVFTTIPDQFTGTVGSISNVNTYIGNTANVFTFGITNNSGNTAVVNYGYTKL